MIVALGYRGPWGVQRGALEDEGDDGKDEEVNDGGSDADEEDE